MSWFKRHTSEIIGAGLMLVAGSVTAAIYVQWARFPQITEMQALVYLWPWWLGVIVVMLAGYALIERDERK